MNMKRPRKTSVKQFNRIDLSFVAEGHKVDISRDAHSKMFGRFAFLGLNQRGGGSDPLGAPSDTDVKATTLKEMISKSLRGVQFNVCSKHAPFKRNVTDLGPNQLTPTPAR